MHSISRIVNSSFLERNVAIGHEFWIGELVTMVFSNSGWSLAETEWPQWASVSIDAITTAEPYFP